MSREIKNKHLGRHDRRQSGRHSKFEKYSQHKLAMAVLHHHYQAPPEISESDQETAAIG